MGLNAEISCRYNKLNGMKPYIKSCLVTLIIGLWSVMLVVIVKFVHLFDNNCLEIVVVVRV